MSNDRVTVTGIGLATFRRDPESSLKSLAAEAIEAALADAGVEAASIDAVFASNSLAGIVTGQECIRGQTVCRPLGIGGVPIVNVENACASGSTAIHLATSAIRAGQKRRVLVVGYEKMTHHEKLRAALALAGAADVDEVPIDPTSPTFMEIYSRSVKRYMESSGATAADFAWVASKNRDHAALNEHALFRTPISAEEVLASRTIVDPLTLAMCSPTADGAAAVILESAGMADGRPTVTIVGSALGSGTAGRSDDSIPSVADVARAAYDDAGVSPSDVDVAEVHDAVSAAEVSLYEAIGLCPPGDGPKLVAEQATRLGGRVPVNTSGGLVSKGHPVGATGVAQIVELTSQLRGGAGRRQVDNARVAVAENGGGYVGGDVAAVAVHILQRL